MKISHHLAFAKSLVRLAAKACSGAIVFDAPYTRNLLPLVYSYQATSAGSVSYEMHLSGVDLCYELYTMVFPKGRPARGVVCLSYKLPSVKSGDVLTVSLNGFSATHNGKLVSPVTTNVQRTRKFIAELQVTVGDERFSRLCSHYLPYRDKSVGSDYYFGDDYIDYPKQTGVDPGLELMRKYCSGGRLLDVGCAMGIYTQAFQEAGFDVHGIDISEFAVAEAGKRVGSDRIRHCNLDNSEIPFAFPFDVLWMWDVLEHFAHPQKALEKATNGASTEAWLFLHTSNADSLTHRIFQSDWEGYSDYSHRGVDQVTVASLKTWLDQLGWEIVEWDCGHIWVEGVDPVVMRLREAFHNLPELSTLLLERELGDAITVVAKRRSARKLAILPTSSV